MQTAVAADMGPGFSLHNKSKSFIYVRILNDPSFLDKAKKLVFDEGSGVLSQAFHDKTIDISKSTELTIFNRDGKVLFEANFKPNKTIYVNWDDQHTPKLYPQRGPLLGVTKKTDKGYSLEKNVTQTDILPAK